MTNREFASSRHPARAVALLLCLWFAGALVLSVSGVLYGAPASVLGATNGSLVVLVLLAVFLVRRFWTWVMTVPLRWLVLYHSVRFVGIAFLVLHGRGALPSAFALHAGWGDVAVAATALLVVFGALPVARRGQWWAVLLWNVFGLLDIGVVIGTGMRLGLEDMDQMAVLTAFPLSLLPTFIVPLIIVTHVLIFVRLWRMREQSAA